MTPPIQLQQIPKRRRRAMPRAFWTTLLAGAALGSALVWNLA